ncbi:conserved hypothetical protein [Ricinus communis]|uniref:Uncharacterized protein n=1 Tax=Ricinus communis TaxID=3988 RepID=B9SAA1_RICCO|nr:conserved hypothetical protein [Ricinus communis]
MSSLFELLPSRSASFLQAAAAGLCFIGPFEHLKCCEAFKIHKVVCTREGVQAVHD